jgi:hypothetical protein
MSPDLANDLTAETTTTRLTVGEKSLAGGYDGDTETALNTGQLLGAAIDAVTRTGDSLDSLDRRTTTVSITEHKLQESTMGLFSHLIPVDVSLIDEDLGNAYLHLGRRHGNTLMSDRHRVANSRKHVCNRICNGHGYHEAFRTPGSSPLDANSRTQMRHIPKSRRYARARPQRLQRL